MHPLIEGVHDDVGGDGIGGEPLLDETGECGPHHRPVETELVHQLQAGSGLEECRRRLDIPRRGLQGEVLGADFRRRVLEFELNFHGPRRGHLVERRVRDVVADLTLDGDLGSAVDLHILNDALVGGREEFGERIRRLVHVVVDIEHREVQFSSGHGAPRFGVSDPEGGNGPLHEGAGRIT